jgi:hypothetical protein
MRYFNNVSPLFIGFLSGWLFAIYIVEVFVPKGEMAMCRKAVNEYHVTVQDYQDRLAMLMAKMSKPQQKKRLASK